MTIAALWWNTSWFYLSEPAVELGIKNSQIAMIFLAVVASENVQFVFKQRGCMVLYLWCLNVLVVLIALSVRFIRVR